MSMAVVLIDFPPEPPVGDVMFFLTWAWQRGLDAVNTPVWGFYYLDFLTKHILWDLGKKGGEKNLSFQKAKMTEIGEGKELVVGILRIKTWASQPKPDPCLQNAKTGMCLRVCLETRYSPILFLRMRKGMSVSGLLATLSVVFRKSIAAPKTYKSAIYSWLTGDSSFSLSECSQNWLFFD